MGDVGSVATLINTVASWFMSEDGYAEWSKRRALQKKAEEAHDALDKNDWDALRKHVADLKRMSDKS